MPIHRHGKERWQGEVRRRRIWVNRISDGKVKRGPRLRGVVVRQANAPIKTERADRCHDPYGRADGQFDVVHRHVVLRLPHLPPVEKDGTVDFPSNGKAILNKAKGRYFSADADAAGIFRIASVNIPAGLQDARRGVFLLGSPNTAKPQPKCLK